MRSLAARLTLAFLLILLVFGALGLWLAERGARAYFTEFTQRLNAPIAMYMAENGALLDERGEIDRPALAELAEHVTMINPSVEVYLLDPGGVVVAQASTANLIARPHVSLEPVHAFIAAGANEEGRGAREPLLGDNPMQPGEPRAFSAHPLLDEGRLVGYVYAVLAGRSHETLLDSVRTSHSLRTLVILLGCALALAALAGGIVFFSMTRRLQALTRRVQAWQRSDAEAHPEPDPIEPRPAPDAPHRARPGPIDERAAGLDEIDRLAAAHDTLRRRLGAQYEKLAERDRSRRELFAGISHDLRTPLTTLEGYLETLLIGQERQDPATVRRYLSIAQRQSRRLQRLIGELFELSRLDAGEFVLVREPFSLLELAHDAVQDVAMVAERRGIRLSVAPERIADASLDVDADIALVQRVFENLLGNALRYTEDGGAIGIALERVDASRVQVSVSDDGVGMRPEDAARVFEPRFTPDTDARRDEERAGLGLAIADRVVSLHGGRIGVRSRLGEGSVFTFTLPAAHRSTDTDARAADAPPPEAVSRRLPGRAA